MGMAGSDHDHPVQKSAAGCDDGEVASNRVGTLAIQRVDDGTCAYHIVKCKLAGTTVSLEQKFTSTCPEDPEGRIAAFRFAISTGSLPAFKTFLFKHLEFVNSGSTCLTDQRSFMAVINLRKNSLFGLCFSAAVCRFPDGSLHSISFRTSHEQVGFERVIGFFHSSKIRSWFLRAIKRTATISSEVENCRSDGVFMGKCNFCGAVEPSECTSQKCQQDSEQASEDYLCSACLMMEKKKVIYAIRLEEQGEVAKNWDVFPSEAGPLHMESNREACCICGCEDNEDLDDLVSCSCQFSEAVVHTSCSAACQSLIALRASASSSALRCLICGRDEAGTQNGGLVTEEIQTRGSKRSTSLQGAGHEMKRPRTSSIDGIMQVENMPEVDRSLNNVGISLNDQHQIRLARRGWRSANTPAVVPFKKRRIQITEVPRSPSPPLKPLVSKDVPHSPQRPLLEIMSSEPLPTSSSAKPNDSCSMDAASMLSLPMPLLSPKSDSPVPKSCISGTTAPALKMLPSEATSLMTRSSSPRPVSLQSKSLAPDPVSSSPKSSSPKPTSSTKTFSRTFNLSPVQLPTLPSGRMAEENTSPVEFPEEQKRSQVSSPCCARDALNTIKEIGPSSMRTSFFCANQSTPISSSQEVEDGELVISIEKKADDIETLGELPEVTSQVVRGHNSRGSRSDAGGSCDGRLGWDLNTDMETWDQLSDRVSPARIKTGKGSRMVGVLAGRRFERGVKRVRANESLKSRSCGSSKERTGVVNGYCSSISPCREAHACGEVPAVYQSEEFGERGAGASGGEESAFKVTEEDCERQGLYRYNSAERVERQANLQRINAEEGRELANEPGGEEHVDYGDFDYQEGDDVGMEMDFRSATVEDEAHWKGEGAPGNPFCQERNSRLDGVEREMMQEDLKTCSTSGRVKPSGWDQLPEGFESAEEAMKAAQEVLLHSGRGSWVSFGGRGLASFSARRFNFKPDDIRESSGRSGDRHFSDISHSRESFNQTTGVEDSDDNYNASGTRSFGQPVAGSNGRGCYNGYPENHRHDSTDHWGQGRLRSTSGFSSQGAPNTAARREHSGFVGPDETFLRGNRSSQVMRSTHVYKHGVKGPHISHRAPSADMDGEPNFSSRVQSGLKRSVGRTSNIWTKFGEKGVQQGDGAGFTGSMSERGVFAGRGFGDRYGGSSFGSRSLEPRRGCSPHRMHSPDGSYANDRYSPGARTESRIKRLRFSPPSTESLSRSKVYPSSGQNQCSPPSYYKLSNNRREADSFRERDIRRPVPRYGASGRTSPHVVHGSSLMDERDLQVLAGTRSSPGARGDLSSYRDRSLEVRWSRRAEEEGRRGSISKDRDYGKNIPRELDKNRDVRGIAYKRDRSRDDYKGRDSYRALNRPTGGPRHSGSRDGNDEFAPRRY